MLPAPPIKSLTVLRRHASAVVPPWPGMISTSRRFPRIAPGLCIFEPVDAHAFYPRHRSFSAKVRVFPSIAYAHLNRERLKV